MSDFSTLDLLIENMDSSLDGPLSSREVECVAKGWRQGEATANAEITRLQGENEALRAEADEARSKYVQNLKVFHSAAIAICQQESEEWDSDRLKTHKDYAEACGQRISGLSLVTARAWVLRKQAEALEEIVDADPDGRSEDGGVLVAMDTIWDYAQTLRTQAAALERQSVEGGDKP